MDTETLGQAAAYNLREEKGDVRHCWVIERADGSVCFRLARKEWKKEWKLAGEILNNLLLELSRDEESRRDVLTGLRRAPSNRIPVATRSRSTSTSRSRPKRL